MSLVTVEGIYMNNEIVPEKTFGDRTNPAHLLLDIYQPDSPQKNKMVQVKVADLALSNKLSKDFMLGAPISVKATLNAYQNQVYYSFVEFVESKQKTA